ncbi:hypothetical protein [Streptacidiphilus fuscans]|uniref:Uncharacterized protein n=1 Tax=Streptacidiphilus fuscans TaxID=2789292 RepID=A0A931AYV1_9ACTN|nr:hypothetical protein [Streptacidiphilus fuscans]MBF9067241.1 hypothetical protein [Streptacidiphilus fuscans]
MTTHSTVPGKHHDGRIPAPVAARPLDPRRRLQLALAAVWLLDGILQFQPYMFTLSFGKMTLYPMASGNPVWVAGPVHWVTTMNADHPVATNAVFALVQVLLGIGIACRPTVKPALLASTVWAVGVWWLGEGLGGLFAGTANPLTGAPGAAVLYGLLAVLLWPSERPSAFPAAARIGERPARAVWVLLWAAFAYLVLQPANRAPGAVQGAVTNALTGAPGWLVQLGNHVGKLAAGHDLAISVVLAVAFALVGLSVLLPWRRAVTAGLVGAVVLAALIWVFGEGFGMPFQGMATDPNSGPLLVLLAAAYWPARRSIRTETATA